MNSLPVIQRELRVQARRPATYWGRWLLLLFVFLPLLPWVLYSLNDPAGTGGGAGVFQALAWTAVLLASGGGALTADSLSSERREGTLGLLFLTELTGRDVVLGVFVTRGLWALYAVVGLVPMFGVSLLAGGVTGGEVARVALVLLATLAWSLAAGLAVSARQSRQTRALGEFFAVVMALAILPLLAGWLGDRLTGWDGIKLLSPLGLMSSAADSAWTARPGEFWTSLGLVAATTGLFLILAARALAANWREAVGADTAPPDSRRGGRHLGSADPIAWLVRQQPGQLALLCGGLAALGLAVSNLLVYLRTPLSTPLSIVVVLLGFCLLGWAAARFFLETRRSGWLELLLTTPVGARGLVNSQWLVLQQQARRPFAWTLMGALLLPWVLGRLMGVGFGSGFLFSTLLEVATLPLDALVCGWLGLWVGLRARNAIGAVGLVLGLGYALPYMVSLVLWTLVWHSGGQSLGLWVLLLYYVSAVAVKVWLILWARRQLRRDLRACIHGPRDWWAVQAGTPARLAAAVRRLRHWTPS